LLATLNPSAARRIGKIPIEGEQLVEPGIGRQGSAQSFTSSSAKSLTTMDKTGRNEPCPCGSGKKNKKCCLPKHEADQRSRPRLRCVAFRADFG
jgi:hypothetical protein